MPTGTYTKYSFPSKTMEYLLSGIPTVMYKLEGIPDEYNAFLNYFPSENTNEVADYINELINQEYLILLDKANRGKEFVLKEKNAIVQAQKILDLMNNA